MNSAGETWPRRGVTPPQQCLEAGDPSRAQVDDRLIDDLELAPGERAVQVELERRSRLHALVHGCVEEAVGAAPFSLGAIQCEISVADEPIGLRAAIQRQHDADAGAHVQHMAVHLVGCVERVDDALRELGRLSGVH